MRKRILIALLLMVMSVSTFFAGHTQASYAETIGTAAEEKMRLKVYEETFK